PSGQGGRARRGPPHGGPLARPGRRPEGSAPRRKVARGGWAGWQPSTFSGRQLGTPAGLPVPPVSGPSSMSPGLPWTTASGRATRPGRLECPPVRPRLTPRPASHPSLTRTSPMVPFLPVPATAPPAVTAAVVLAAPACADEAKYVKLVHKDTGKVLAVEDNSGDAGARVILAKDDANTAQWKFEKDGEFYKVVNRKTGKVLDVFEDSREEGAAIIQWDEKSEGIDNQRWAWEGDGKVRRLKA